MFHKRRRRTQSGQRVPPRQPVSNPNSTRTTLPIADQAKASKRLGTVIAETREALRPWYWLPDRGGER